MIRYGTIPALALALLLAACSQQGDSNQNLPYTSAGGRAASLSMQSASDAVVVSGVVTGMTSQGFVLNAGYNENAIDVADAGAAMYGEAPQVGEGVVVRGNGTTAAISASQVSQVVAVPAGTNLYAGTVSDITPTKFLLHTSLGYVYVNTTPSTVLNPGPPATGQYLQTFDTGNVRSGLTALYVSSWAAAPASSLTTSGTVANVTPWGLTLNVDAAHSALPVVLSAATRIAGPPASFGSAITVTGAGSINQNVAVSQITVAVPTPAPIPTPVVLKAGGVVGLDNQFMPVDSDMPAGGQGQSVDSIPCNATMSENAYHVHAWLGILDNGRQIAVPDGIGMYRLGPEVNGIENYAQCFYYIHTHDATGMIHVESPISASLFSAQYTLGDMLDIWGVNVDASSLGPYYGDMRAFIASAPGESYATNYIEYVGDVHSLLLSSHEAIWLEIGPQYELPPNLPAVRFYTEY
mgnify:CR=1 FL=1